MTGRKSRKWLQEIADIVYDPSANPSVAYLKIREKLDKTSFRPSSVRGLIAIPKTQVYLNAVQLINVKAALKDATKPNDFSRLIGAIKLIREYTGLGLKEAKEYAESLVAPAAPRRRSSREQFRAAV